MQAFLKIFFFERFFVLQNKWFFPENNTEKIDKNPGYLFVY
jgi:hypothetical protein